MPCPRSFGREGVEEMGRRGIFLGVWHSLRIDLGVWVRLLIPKEDEDPGDIALESIDQFLILPPLLTKPNHRRHNLVRSHRNSNPKIITKKVAHRQPQPLQPQRRPVQQSFNLPLLVIPQNRTNRTDWIVEALLFVEHVAVELQTEFHVF